MLCYMYSSAALPSKGILFFMSIYQSAEGKEGYVKKNTHSHTHTQKKKYSQNKKQKKSDSYVCIYPFLECSPVWETNCPEVVELRVGCPPEKMGLQPCDAIDSSNAKKYIRWMLYTIDSSDENTSMLRTGHHFRVSQGSERSTNQDDFFFFGANKRNPISSSRSP